MVFFFCHIIRFYQKIAHALFPSVCRFYPSCSFYAIDALEKHGMLKGLSKALLRICRCSPLAKGGYDPVK